MSNVIYEPQRAPGYKPFRQPGVEESCGGWCAHSWAPPGESLIGWYKSYDEAVTAVMRYYSKYSVVVDDQDRIVLLHQDLGEAHSALKAWLMDSPSLPSLYPGKTIDNFVFDGGFGFWAARHMPER